jgi:hypothetical protein
MQPRQEIDPKLMEKVQNQLELIFKEIAGEKNISIFDLLFGLFGRLGFEMGRIFRIFQNNDLNWGFFADHDPYGTHCNAHLNNFIILKDHKNLLAPVDFDLAFFREHFVHLIPEDVNSYGLKDDTIFDEYMNNQRYPLESGIAGVENMNFLYNTMIYGQ